MSHSGKAPMDFGEHKNHAVHPHNHAGQPDEPPYRRDEWCSGRWLCATCTGKGAYPRGTWFGGPRCTRPRSAARGGAR